MRTFVVLGHEAPTDPGFSLDDLAGGAGRLDVLCRCVNAAFLLSHGIREGVRAYLVLRDAVTLRFEGGELRYLAPDERNIASLVRTALEAAGGAVGHQAVESTPGIYASRLGFADVLGRVGGPVVQLHEDGDPLTEAAPGDDAAFVLSDHRGFSDEETAVLGDHGAARVSLGPERLHADHAITVAHNYLDTAGYTRYRAHGPDGTV